VGTEAHREERIGGSVLPLPANDKRLKETDCRGVKGGWKRPSAVGQ
jgi:hypothetical protein